MRLLNAASLKFKEFADAEIPPYAILSHTWQDKQEVTLQDMASPYLTEKLGYDKITETCTLALRHNLQWAWIDTCCIDKTNNTELTESINSMFRWYQNATVCFVHLVDFTSSNSEPPPPNSGGGVVVPDNVDDVQRCAWFRRGWTLQELLAPRNVQFYDCRWDPIGSKIALAPLLADITRIPAAAIVGEERLSRYSTAQRMAWASSRVTTKIEDAAYCLLGLFDVNMPLIYGEGSRAFQRLQEEIIKRTTDLTLFAWMPATPAPAAATSFSTANTSFSPSPSPAPPDEAGGAYMPLLASAPAEFAHCLELQQFRNDDSEFTVTNRGLRITTYLVLVPLSLDMSSAGSSSDPHRSSSLLGSSIGSVSEVGGADLGGSGGGGTIPRKKVAAPPPSQYARYRYVLSIGYAKSSVSEIGVWLKKIGPGLFLREAGPSLAHLSKNKLKYTNTTENHTFYILMQPNATSGATSSGGDPQIADALMSPVLPAEAAMMPAHHHRHGPHPVSVSPPLGSTAAFPPPAPPPHNTSAAAAAAAQAAQAAHGRLRTVYHPRLFPRGMHIPYFGDRGIYFSSFPPQSWDERTRIFCQPESRNDVVAFSCSSRQGPEGRDNLSFGVLVDYRQKRDAPRCLVINRHSLESRFLFVLSMRQSGEPARWYVMENELPTISASKNALRMAVEGEGGVRRTYEIVATVAPGRVQIDEHQVTMPTLDVTVTNVTNAGVKVA